MSTISYTNYRVSGADEPAGIIEMIHHGKCRSCNAMRVLEDGFCIDCEKLRPKEAQKSGSK